MGKINITFSTCFYVVKSKFDTAVYLRWIENFMRLTCTNNFYLVIYTDEDSLEYINLDIANNNNVRVILKPFESFHGYKYKDKWISNHENNKKLNFATEWMLNMIWSEKVYFVQETMQQNYFEDTDFYGWCDIGYFRNRPEKDIPMDTLIQHGWPKPECIHKLDQTKIVYSFVNIDSDYLNSLYNIIVDKNQHGLPNNPIPDHQISVAGGFFIAPKNMVDWWVKTYTEKLLLYFEHGYLVKDDQIILIDCIFSDASKFSLITNLSSSCESWFMFQRVLCDIP